MRRNQYPTSPTALDRDNRRQYLLATIGLFVAKLYRRIPAAGLGEPRQDAALRQAVEFGAQLLCTNARRRGDIIELLVGACIARAEHEPQCTAVIGVLAQFVPK
jgi:hypothetical protein